MAEHALVQPIFWKNSLGADSMLVGTAGTDTKDGGEEPLYKEAAAQTYKAGDLVYIDSSGLIAICTNAANRLNSEILGQAMKDATGTTDAPVYVRVIRPSDIYLMNVFHSTKASATITQTRLGEVYGIILNSGKWHVDVENTTVEDATTALAKVRVIGFPSRVNGVANAINDIYGFVAVQFLPFTIATDGSPFTRNLQIV